jgi:hypothetical protein
MMNSELWRYSRRQLDNVLSLTGDEQFQSTILMMKMFEAQACKVLESIVQHLGIENADTNRSTTVIEQGRNVPAQNTLSDAHRRRGGSGGADQQFADVGAGKDSSMMFEAVRMLANKMDQQHEMLEEHKRLLANKMDQQHKMLEEQKRLLELQGGEIADIKHGWKSLYLNAQPRPPNPKPLNPQPLPLNPHSSPLDPRIHHMRLVSQQRASSGLPGSNTLHSSPSFHPPRVYERQWAVPERLKQNQAEAQLHAQMPEALEGKGSSKMASGDEAEVGLKGVEIETAAVSADEGVVEGAAGSLREDEDPEEQKGVEASKQAEAHSWPALPPAPSAVSRAESASSLLSCPQRRVGRPPSWSPKRPAFAGPALGGSEAGTPKTPAGFLPGFDPSAVKLRSRRLGFTPEASGVVEDLRIRLESEDAVASSPQAALAILLASAATCAGSEEDSEADSSEEESSANLQEDRRSCLPDEEEASLAHADIDEDGLMRVYGAYA